MITRLIFVLATAIGMIPITHAEDSDYLKHVDAAEKAIAAGQWQEAEAELLNAMRSEPTNPSNPLLLSNLGMVRFYNGHDSLAIVTLNAAHDFAPSSVTILANRARVLAATHRIAEALSDYDTIERLDSTYYAPYLYRGLINLYSGNFETAESDLTKLKEINPDSEDTWIALASLYAITSRPEEALPYYRRLIETSPSAEYYAGRAMCLLEKDMLVDAAEDIASGLELDPDYGELYLCRAILNKKRYCRDDALHDANRAIELGTDRNRIKALLGL